MSFKEGEKSPFVFLLQPILGKILFNVTYMSL